MAEISAQISQVNQKLQQLLKRHQQVQKENSRLQQQLETARVSQLKDQEIINQLQQQVAILKVAAGLMNEADKKAFDKQISQYIKEIEKCMAMLSE